MRSPVSTRLLASCLGVFAIVAGCAGEDSTNDGLGGQGATASDGGNGVGGGMGGGGGAGGTACVPGTEICDGIDNDCNEQIDEVAGGCDCNDGDTQPCYSGRPARSAGVGLCVAGSQTCADGKWGTCEGEVTPQPETCNQLDDDCNGTADDMGTSSCGVGACAATVDVCVNGELQTCTPGTASVEVCDGVDNNCNQLTDEADPLLGAACNSGLLGVCQAGLNVCQAGQLVCAPSQMPGSEICDSLDNNCDGTPDNNIPGTGGACSTGQFGVCAPGTVSCQGGTIDCFANTAPSLEICDSLDNDCNGVTDEDDPLAGTACNTGLFGVCQAGLIDCQAGALVCTQITASSGEVCNNIDDDCDGTADDGNPGGGAACGCGGTGMTACVGGAITCQGGPATYFQEDFSDNSAGWVLGPEWQIGPALAGPAGNCADPGTDTTSTADNGVAGVIIGGCSTSSVSATLHGQYYLTSPPFNANAAGNVILSFKRWLHSDYTPYMNNVIEVFNGSSWVVIWQSGGTGISDASWQTITHDLTAYKSAAMQVRFGFNIGAAGVFSEGSWNIDDVVVASAVCP